MKPLHCPHCGRFSRESWDHASGTQNGTVYTWGGICLIHGEWEDST